MKTARSLVAGLCALLAAVTATAGDTRRALLVDSQWLRAELSDPRLVLLHVGAEDEFAAGHIGGRGWSRWTMSRCRNTPAAG